MRLTPAIVATDAMALLRRDAALLLALAGPFWFLPAYAVALLVPTPPERTAIDAQATLAWAQAFGAWLRVQGPWYLAAWAVGLLGTATVYRLYLDTDRPDLRAALAGAVTLWPRLALMSAVAAMLVGLGLWMLVLPGLYLLGRLLPAGAALTAERPLSALGALRRSFALTQGAGLALMAVTTATLGAGWLLSHPLLLLDTWLRAQSGGGNPVAIAIVDAGAAAVSAVAALAGALLGIAAYRRLAR